jgi:hypothetical protein
MKKAWGFLTFLFFLVACTAPEKVLTVTSTPSMIVTQTPTVTRPTQKLLPTWTPTIAFGPTGQALWLEMTPFAATQAVQQTRNVAARPTFWAMMEEYCPPYSFRDGFPLYSHDRKMVALVCQPVNGDISKTVIIHLDGSRPPVELSYRRDFLKEDPSAPYSDRIQQYFDQGASYYLILDPFYWTPDDKYLFLSEGYCSGSGASFMAVSNILRLELESGKLQTYLENNCSTYTLSRDGTRLIFMSQTSDPAILQTIDLLTGEIFQVNLGRSFDQSGNLMLSPDGRMVLFTVYDDDFIGFIVVDLLSKTYFSIETANIYDIFSLRWIDNSIIHVEENSTEGARCYYLNIKTSGKEPVPCWFLK